jgi:predicted Rdx family selenoprotein
MYQEWLSIKYLKVQHVVNRLTWMGEELSISFGGDEPKAAAGAGTGGKT